jgi:hypothetical protein
MIFLGGLLSLFPAGMTVGQKLASIGTVRARISKYIAHRKPIAPSRSIV